MMTPKIIERLLSGEKGNVYVCSIHKDRLVDARELHIASREAEKLQKFAKDKDVDGRSTFFCVSTIKRSRRNKDSALESHFLFADVDFKSVNGTKEEILSLLQCSMELPPSQIVFTGNGYHVYWFLDRPSLPDNQAAFENALRRLAWVVAGDPMVCHVAALLRYPGTHNSKRGQWTEVEVVGGSGCEYSFTTLTSWLSGVEEPVLTRRPRDRDANPFLAAAEDVGFRPPMNVEQELQDMVLGGGERGIHMTQLRAAASLMSAGVSVDEAVNQIIEATQRHAEPGWNMNSERRAVRRMCTDWLRKHPRDRDPDGASSSDPDGNAPDGEGGGTSGSRPPRRRRSASSASCANGSSDSNPESGDERAEDDNSEGDDGVVSLSQAREHKRRNLDDEPDSAVAPAKLKKIKKGNEHIALAPGILAAMAERDEHMLYTEGRMHLYRGGLWRIQTTDEEKSYIDYQTEIGCRALNISPTIRIASEVRAALRREPTIHKAHVAWDSHGHLPVKNGLIDPGTLELKDFRPDHYATASMNVLYDPEATAPKWVRFLEELLPSAETRNFLQECVGMAMVKVKPRSLTRALILLGPSFSGKSNVLNIISSLIDKEVNSTALEMLENSHGLVKFLNPHPWVLHEAFEQSRWEMSANVKALISGDPVTINVKNGPLVSHQYRGAVLWATNVPPQFKESSRAIETRIAVVKFKKVFDPGTVTGLAREAQDAGYSSISEMILDTERSGILNWALEGMRRAIDRGHFVFTQDMVSELEQIRNVSNVAVGFFSDCVEFHRDSMLHVSDLYAAFVAWWEENQGGATPSVSSLGRAIAAMSDPRMLHHVRFSRTRVSLGIRLNEEGLDLWTARANAANMERSTLRISGTQSEVNVSPIPERLLEREEVAEWVRSMWGE